MDEFNAVNEAQAGNVDCQEDELLSLRNEPEEVKEDLDSALAPMSENKDSDQGDGGLDLGGSETKGRDFERDRLFAKIRREAENAGREAAERRYAPLMEALGEYGYQGTPAEQAEALKAAQMGIDISTYRERMEEENKKILNHPIVKNMADELEHFKEEALEAEFNMIASRDLEAIKKAFPKSKCKSVHELGDRFFAMRSSGVDPVCAYKVVMEEKSRLAPPVVGNAGDISEKSYFTLEEIKDISANHKERLNDPKILKKINESLARG